jgi:tRNA threonylcarbamoyladenosine biosynthesis protein TsaE
VQEFQSNSPQKTKMIAREFAGNLKPFDFVSITGHLGAGKTKFTSGIVDFFCNEKEAGGGYILSPTYTIMNSYNCNVTINHFDFYRLKRQDELENCGFFDSLSNGAITIAEWTDKIPMDYKKYIEGNYYEVDIAIGKEGKSGESFKNKRHIKIEKIL